MILEKYPTMVFVDLETTGFKPGEDKVIEVGIVLIKNGNITREYSTLVNPKVKVSDEITQITGIKNSQLLGAPTFDQIIDEVEELINPNDLFIAHNAAFDYGFLKEEFNTLGRNFYPAHLDTLRLSRKLFPGHASHSLDSIIKRFQIKVQNRHRAFDDAFALWEFYKAIFGEYSEDYVHEIIYKTLKPQQKPQVIGQQMFF